jgi:pimeloyl-ACP methyl ester carboxylesterase
LDNEIMLPERQDGFIEHDGADIHFTSYGEGQALVFVHAGIADNRMWQPQVEFFSPRYRVVTFDLRGFGQTAMVAGDFSDAEDLRAVMDALGIQKAVVIGCSMGGSAAINFALQNPLRTLALVPVASGLDGFEVEDDEGSVAKWQQVAEARSQKDFDRFAESVVSLWIAGPRRKPEEVNPGVRAFVKEMLRTSFNTPEGLGKRIKLTPSAASRLGEIHVPTLVMAGSEDVPEMAFYARKVSQGISGATLHILEKAGHLPSLERPTEFNQLLDVFLKEAL